MRKSFIKFLRVPMVLLMVIFITACGGTGDNSEALDTAKDELAIQYAASNSILHVTSNLTLPSQIGEFDVTWVSGNTDVITNAGVVTRPAADTPVMMTATITDGELSVTKVFVLMVKAVPIVTYSVTFNVDGGSAVDSQTIVSGAKATAPTAPTKANYTFDGWYKEVGLTTAWNFATDTVTSNTTLYAKWTPITFTVTFNVDGGSAVASLPSVMSGTMITAPTAPTKAHYTFDGWYKEVGLTTAWNFVTDTVTANTTLYAKWTPVTYTVTFDVDGGSAVASLPSVMSGTMITAPTAPTKANYTFDGWYKEVGLTTAWNFATDTVTSNTTLYAKWTPITYTVTFDVDGGSAVASLPSVMSGTMITAPTAPTKANYTFDGWYKEVGLTTAWNFATDTVTSNTTLYAKWTPITYTVTFEVDGGVAIDPLTNVMQGSTITEPTAPTKDGFDFMGWYKEVGLTTAWNFATDTVTSNTTLYAKWEASVVVPAGTAIATAQEFHDMTKSGSNTEYYLANDIDFTGFTWTVTGNGTSFGGVLNGNGKTISNITITGEGTGVYGGIFQRTNGAVIHDLTIDNANVNAVGRVGVLIGRIETAETTINNVVIKNSSAAGTAGEGVGVVIGNASLSFTITNLQVLNSTATNTNKNVAFIAGRSDHAATMTDVYIFGSTAESTNFSTDAGVGGIIGYTNAATSAVTLTRVVIEDSILKGRSAGSLIGYFRFGALTATDVLTDIEFIYAGSDGQHGVIGRRNVDANTTDPVFTNVFAHFVTQQAGAAIQLLPAFVLANLTGLDQAWWSTNLGGIHNSAAWEFDLVSKFFQLLQ
ncbi:MAG: InlB B-repeat-containing protein [Firmicutes bacterium]|nr:InlB B-repeat-containing protein [Bacillota bacterium]